MLLVKESLDFKRGLDPKSSMKIGLSVILLNRLEKIKELDTRERIFSIELNEEKFNYLYIYLNTGEIDFEDEKTKKLGKKIFQKYIEELIIASGLSDYLIYHSMIEYSICYRIKPEFRKAFKEVYIDLFY